MSQLGGTPHRQARKPKCQGGEEEAQTYAAALKRHPDILSLLIDHGADKGGGGKDGHTPLPQATLNENSKLDDTYLIVL